MCGGGGLVVMGGSEADCFYPRPLPSLQAAPAAFAPHLEALVVEIQKLYASGALREGEKVLLWEGGSGLTRCTFFLGGGERGTQQQEQGSGSGSGSGLLLPRAGAAAGAGAGFRVQGSGLPPSSRVQGSGAPPCSTVQGSGFRVAT